MEVDGPMVSVVLEGMVQDQIYHIEVHEHIIQ